LDVRTYHDMERHIEITKDGSATLYNKELGEHYHSTHGAVQESMHVFINAGLEHYINKTGAKALSILEAGLGTGLNAMLTYQYATARGMDVYYEAIEAYPVTAEESRQLNYAQPGEQELFALLHSSAWNEPVGLSKNFALKKVYTQLEAYTAARSFDVIYYDAFSPNAQPELWTEKIFATMYGLLNDGGVLVTYCSKSIVQKAMKAAGFTIQKLAGPPGKREMIRAVK